MSKEKWQRRIARITRPNALPCGCQIYNWHEGRSGALTGQVIIMDDGRHAVCIHEKTWNLEIRWQENQREVGAA